MEFLIRIEDATYLPKRGFVIIGNNPDWTSTDISKLNVKGSNILVRTSQGDFYFEVINLKISLSFIGNPVIGFILSESENFNKISCGDLVYKV